MRMQSVDVQILQRFGKPALNLGFPSLSFSMRKPYKIGVKFDSANYFAKSMAYVVMVGSGLDMMLV